MHPKPGLLTHPPNRTNAQVNRVAARGPELLGEMDARTPGGRTDQGAASAPVRSGQMRTGVLPLKPRTAPT